MFDHSLSAELLLNQSASDPADSFSQTSISFAPTAKSSNGLQALGQTFPESQAIEAALLPTVQELPFLITLWQSPELEALSPVKVLGDTSDNLLGNHDRLSQPLVGILDTGFDLRNNSQTSLLSNGDNQQIYLGYDWVDGDANPLVTDGLSTSHGSQILAALNQANPLNEPVNLWLGRAVGSGNWAASLVEFVATAKALGHNNAVANLSFDLTEIQADGSITPRTALSNDEIAALSFARQQGVIVVAAAGNDNATVSALAQASQQFDNILTVGAAQTIGPDTDRANYSNYGEGLSLIAELPAHSIGLPQGTSLAATQVTQAVQTLWQQYHGLSYSQVIDLLEGSATDLQAPGWDQYTGHGLLNLSQALSDANQASSTQLVESTTKAFNASLFNPWDFTANNPSYLERPLALDVGQVIPGNGTTNIDTQASIRVQFANEAIDSNSLTSDSFKLVDSNGNAIAASIGSDITGGVISLTPQGPLDPFSTYNIVITDDLLNNQGQAATPFSSSFTTGSQGSSPAGLRFNNQQAINGESRFGVTSIAVGPDGNVYASDLQGNILRYNLDPSTGLATSTDTVFSQSGSQVFGLAFDPNATATNLDLWISYTDRDGSGFASTISKLDLPVTGGGNATKKDYIIGLPNDITGNHQANDITFGPDGKLYQSVGGVSTLGGTPNWGADESLLSAAVIVADVNNPNFPTNQTGGQAVNVRTAGLDIDNDPNTENYDPYASGAPVTIFATGLRNAYDIVWHSNGNLYSGINQNSLGSGQTPASPDGSVPAINARPNEMLALVEQGLYYGHPNPSRGEYVLNGGNPTAGVDPREVPEYPVGVQPNPNFDASLIYDTRSIGGTSPNGLTEYTGPGSLNGRLLVSFFSGARTIQSFELGADGLVSDTAALQDSNGNNLRFNRPLDVAVHPSGRIYVADFGFSQTNPNGGTVRVLTPLSSANVIITPSNGSTEVSEAGATDTYTAALATQPSGAVTIAINPDSQLSSDASSLTFTPANWNVPQLVTVSAVDDNNAEGNHSGSISHSITSGSGSYGTGLAIASLTANITDNDPSGPGFEITETNGSTTVTEGGNSDSLSIRLSTAPTADVVLTLTPDSQLDLGLANSGPANSGPVDLTFTANNWDTAQSITVDAVDDSLVEGNHSGEISYSINSADANYQALVIAPTSVSITDNDAPPGLILQPSGSGTTVTEAGSSDNYQVSLASQPSANVTVNLSVDSQLRLSNGQTPSLTFTPSNWDSPQTVSIGAVDDSIIEGNHSGSITHSISSSDSNYAGLGDETVVATILDNDAPANTGGTALFVAGSTNLSGSDIQARSILEGLGFNITVVDDGASTTADAFGKDLVVISQSVFSNLVGSKFTNVDVPIVVWESFLYDDLGMANNFGVLNSGGTSLTFTNDSHPLAADLALGNQTIYSNGGPFGWGSPTSNEVISIAHTGNPSQLGIFGYETGTAMDIGNAPARRVAANLWETPNGNGTELFTAAVQWATGQNSPPPPPQPGALAFANASFSYGEAGNALNAITVERSGGSAGAVTAEVSISYRAPSNGNASSADLVSSAPVSVTFADGDSGAKVVPLNIVDDLIEEGNEVFDISLAVTSGGANLDPAATTAIVNIIDNDAAGSIELSNSSFSVSESGGNSSITVSRTGGSAGAQTVTLTPTGGTATAGADYDATPISVTFANGEAGDKTLLLPIQNDALSEGNETVNLQLSGNPNTNLGNQTTATLTILDDDLPGISIIPSGGSTTVSEAGTVDDYQIVLNSQPSADVAIALNFNSSQLSLSNSSLTFTPSNWDSPQTVQLSAIDDAVSEGTTVASISHSATSTDANYNSIAIAPLNLSITDNDTPPNTGGTALFVAGSTNLSGSDINARNILEDLGYSVTVVEDGPSSTADANGQDLVVISQSVFSNEVGNKFTNVNVPLIVWESFLYDDLGMANSFGFVQNSSNLTLTNASHPLAAGLASGNQSIYGSTGTLGWGNPSSSEVISIAHTGNPSQLGIFGYEAGAAMDIGTAPARRVAANLWETPNANGDALFKAAVEWATGQSSPPQPQPGTISFANTTFSYNEDSTAINAITVERNGGNDGAVTANLSLSYRPAGAGAASAADIATTFPISISFADGDSSAKTVPLNLVEDLLEEGNEVFDVSLAITSGNATLDPAQSSASVNIIDNDAAGTIEFSSNSFSVSEGAGTTAISLSRVGGSAGIQTVTVTPTDGTATSVIDYESAPVSVTFADGEAGTKLVAIPIVDDAIAEANETIALQLSGNALGQQTQATLSIIDNDSSNVIVTPSGGGTSVSEDGLSDTYQLALSSQPSSNVTVTISFDSSQVSLSDTTLTFTPANWDTPQTVTVNAVDDSDREGSQTFNLTHSAASSDANYDGIAIANLSVTIADNDSSGGNALLIAGSTGLSGSDIDARDLLIRKGYSVTVVDDDVSQTSDANGQDLILISQTTQSTKVNTKFTNTAVPIIVWESFLYDDLGMANSFGFLQNSSNITLTNSNHPLSGGLSVGNKQINGNSGLIGWGNPSNNNVINIAHTGNPSQLTVFGYDAGATMDGLTAPAKRVGLSFWETPDATGNNEALLEAAIDWAST